MDYFQYGSVVVVKTAHFPSSSFSFFVLLALPMFAAVHVRASAHCGTTNHRQRNGDHQSKSVLNERKKSLRKKNGKTDRIIARASATARVTHLKQCVLLLGTCVMMCTTTVAREARAMETANKETSAFAAKDFSITRSSSSVFDGKYKDPNHPGCLRAIERVKATDLARVFGEDGNPGCNAGQVTKKWSLEGKIMDDDKEILIDFSKKGGPKDLVGKWNGSGILFPDGNLWSKL